jgi:hypothetical protein
MRGGNRAQGYLRIFISSCGDTRANVGSARHASPLLSRNERRRMPRQKYFLLHAKIHREIAEQSTIASPRATMI